MLSTLIFSSLLFFTSMLRDLRFTTRLAPTGYETESHRFLKVFFLENLRSIESFTGALALLWSLSSCPGLSGVVLNESCAAL